MYLYSAFGKISLHLEQITQMGLGNWKVIIALGEITSALLFLFPKKNKYGALLLSSYMGGAIIINMKAGISILLLSTFLIIVWIVVFLRHIDFYKKLG